MNRSFLLICLCLMLIAAACAQERAIPLPPNGDAATVSFVCVGDNLIHEQIWRCRKKGEDGRYQFDDLYAPVKKMIQQADIAFVNQETLCGGEALTLSDWPRFNSPQEILDALASTGFNWISAANNHALDRGEEGVLAQLAYLSTLRGVTSTGTNSSREERDTPRILLINEVRVGVASYTAGTNGIAPPQGKEYLVNTADETQMIEDLRILAEQSDIQVIAMHWGEENSTQPTQEQKKLAQMLADAGADVVVGTHPHIIQTPVFLQGVNGNTTLVYYSLGNFMSSQLEPNQMLGAMARFELEFDPLSGGCTIASAQMLPLVTHISSDYQTYAVYLFEEYPEELAQQHALAGKGFTRGALSARIEEVLGLR